MKEFASIFIFCHIKNDTNLFIKSLIKKLEIK